MNSTAKTPERGPGYRPLLVNANEALWRTGLAATVTGLQAVLDRRHAGAVEASGRVDLGVVLGDPCRVELPLVQVTGTSTS